MNGLMFTNNSGVTGPTATNNYYYGVTPNNAKWLAVSGASTGTFPSNILGGGTVIPVVFNGLSITAAGNSGAGISFNPPLQSSVYLIQAQVYAYHQGGTAMVLALSDGVKNYQQTVVTDFSFESKSSLVSATVSTGTTAAINVLIALANIGTGGTMVIGDNQGRSLIPAIAWTVTQIA